MNGTNPWYRNTGFGLVVAGIAVVILFSAGLLVAHEQAARTAAVMAELRDHRAGVERRHAILLRAAERNGEMVAAILERLDVPEPTE